MTESMRASWANLWAYLHEAGGPFQPLDTRVDLHNNRVGVLFGQQAGFWFSGLPWAAGFCEGVWRRGRLWYVEYNRVVRTSLGVNVPNGAR